MQMKEGGMEKKTENLVAEHAHNSLRVSSLPLFTEFGSIAFVNSFDYMTDDRKPVCFLQHHKCYFLLTPVLQLQLFSLQI